MDSFWGSNVKYVSRALFSEMQGRTWWSESAFCLLVSNSIPQSSTVTVLGEEVTYKWNHFPTPVISYMGHIFYSIRMISVSLPVPQRCTYKYNLEVHPVSGEIWEGSLCFSCFPTPVFCITITVSLYRCMWPHIILFQLGRVAAVVLLVWTNWSSVMISPWKLKNVEHLGILSSIWQL